jgi:UTP:GlnB (protein PII) uridylyltransferase
MRRKRLEGADLDRYLERIATGLVQAFSPRQLILFGSFARGDQNRASDVDLVVIAETGEPFHERIGRALDACYRVAPELPVEVLVYTPREWEDMRREGNTFARRVLEEGRVLYECGPQSDRSAALA